MPQKSWAVGEEVLAADFNTYAQNQVVPQFTSAAQRDTQWAAPPNGALCVTTDANVLWQRVAGAWVSTTTREVGYAENTAPAGYAPQNVEVDVPGLSVAVTIAGSRKLLVVAQALSIHQTLASMAFMHLRYGGTTGGTGTQIAQTNSGSNPIGYQTTYRCENRRVYAAATYTFRATMNTNTAGAFLALQSDPTFPAFLQVIDLGA